jgi:hypothetical protein
MLDVMLSSTCYDLLDLRADQYDFLKQRGMIVRLSENFESAFHPNFSTDSIVSCLQNIEQTDVVILLIDRRYGPKLPKGRDPGYEQYADMSATDAEIRHADLNGKPVITFIRKPALKDYHDYRIAVRAKDPSPRTKLSHIKGEDAEREELLFNLIQGRIDLSKKLGAHNWFDDFETTVDLRPRILRRLEQAAPVKARAAIIRGLEVARPVIIDTSTGGNNVGFDLQNVGPGTISSLQMLMSTSEGVIQRKSVAGLIEGATCKGFFSSITKKLPVNVICQYRIRSGHRGKFSAVYKVGAKGHFLSTENLEVDMDLVGNAPDWYTVFEFDHQAWK